jgi:hypothetical protein
MARQHDGPVDHGRHYSSADLNSQEGNIPREFRGRGLPSRRRQANQGATRRISLSVLGNCLVLMAEWLESIL